MREALESVRPYMESHGGDVELLGIEDDVARLRLEGSCNGCAASAATLEQAIETALEEACPDLLGIDVEGVVAPRAPTEAPPETEWVELDGVAELARGATTATEGLMVANVAGTLLAYRDFCASCPAPLSTGMLVGGKLTCSTCGTTFDLPRAGPLRRRRRAAARARCRCCATAARCAWRCRAARRPSPRPAHCELCPISLGEDHRHLLHLVERRIVCVCETCWSMRSGDPEFRPPGSRTVVLDDLVVADDVWSAFQIPVGLSFLMRSSVTSGVIAMYPSPAGATESELDLTAWDALVAANPVLERLEPDAEALIVDRTGDRHRYAIVPVDQSYRMVGLVKSRWEGITGGRGVDEAIDEFFAGLAR